MIENIKKHWKQYLIILVTGIVIGGILFSEDGRSSDSNQQHNHMLDKDEETHTAWTCSMHPQIKQPQKGDCPICGMDLIPIDKGANDSSPAIITLTDHAVAIANIQTTTVKREIPSKDILLQGKVKIDQRRISSQSAHFGGRIEKLFISYKGQRVKRGQPLATIYSPSLVTAQQELIQTLKSKDKYPELLEAARNKLKLLKLTTQQIKAIEKTGQVKQLFTIKADVSGYVIKQNTIVGNYVKKGDILFQIADLNKLWVLFDAYEQDLPFIKKGDQLNFSVSSLKGETFKARVIFIDPVLDPQKRTASVRTDINNSQLVLKPGMFAEGSLKAYIEGNDKLAIPKSAVLWTGKRSVVYVKHPELPSFEMRQVTIAQSLGNHYLISDGLSQGEQIVTNGVFTVDAAAQLNSKYSMMNKPVIPDTIPVYKEQIPGIFKEYLKTIVNGYLTLKDHLVKSDASSSQKAAKDLMAILDRRDSQTSDLQGDVDRFWTLNHRKLRNQLEPVTASDNLEQQRIGFKQFSALMIQTLKSLGTGNMKLFIQYCPMADNDKGAYWISNKQQIMNPYFGDMMLHCGQISDTLQAGDNKSHKNVHIH